MNIKKGIFFFKKNYTGQIIDLESKEKYFVFFRNFNQACDQDIVNFVLKKNNNETIAIVKEVIKKADKTYFFTVKKSNNFLEVVNLDNFPYYIFLKIKELYLYLDKKVAFKVDYFLTYKKVKIQILSTFEKNISLNFLIDEIISESKINTLFSKNIIDETKKIIIPESEFQSRKDLSSFTFVTIDGESAKDFDDAIFVQKENNYWVLYVSIADVSYFVKKNSCLDKEAYERSNSVYYLDKVIPMLPLDISAGFASLQENKKKLTLTCKIIIDNHGNALNYEIFKSFIVSKSRLTYQEVNDFFYQNILSKKLNDNLQVQQMLKSAYQLFKILENKKINAGYLDFNLKEKIFSLKNNEVIFEGFRKDLAAENLIEQFMIFANEKVAEFLVKNHINGIFRVHKKPKREAIENLFNFLKATFSNFNLRFSKEITSKDIQNCLNFIKNACNGTFFYTFVLKAMEKASYDHQNLGHFALGSNYYCHFTSPIRRYADLIVHRALSFYLEKKQKNLYLSKELEVIAKKISEKEVLTDEFCYKIEDLLCCSYLEKFINKKFLATVVSIQTFGIFIQLENEMDGLIFCEKLNEKNYFFDDLKKLYVNKVTKDKLFVSKKVNVVLKSTNVFQRKIDFDLIV